MKKALYVVLSLVVNIAIFLGFWLIGRMINPNLDLDEPLLPHFLVVGVGLILVLIIFLLTSKHEMWEINSRHVLYMAIGAVLFGIFSFLFNDTVFTVPSISQVALRPAVVIPMFFGYAFGPIVGFFTGAVGHILGDALTGSGLSFQWSIGNGLVGLISGLVWLFTDKKKSINIVLLISILIAGVVTVIYFLNPDTANKTINSESPMTISMLSGVSMLIGLAILLIVRFIFGKNKDMVAAVSWAMLGNILGIGFAALADIWIDRITPTEAMVGKFLPAAGLNMVFAAILVPIMVAIYTMIQRRSSR